MPLRASEERCARRTGAANAWAPLSVDPERDLVFVPTSSPSPDYFGGARPGDDRHANSVVALRASRGELVWSYQVVHHDLWDYDVPAQPTLAKLHRDGEERPVPASDVPGEAAVDLARRILVVNATNLAFEVRLIPRSDFESERSGGAALLREYAPMDGILRAFDIETGEELWSDRLPAGGNATPMTYLDADGRQ
jgi:glucose dehydrogenase